MRLMNAFGDRARHTVISAMPGELGAREAIDPSVDVAFPADAPRLDGKPSTRRYRELMAYARQFDLILSYNWGAMDVVAARRLVPGAAPPLIHHEDGFNADEILRLNWKRNLFRRLMLPAAKTVVVPSARLEDIALRIWRVPAARLARIPNGIDMAAYAHPPEPGAIPGLAARPGDVVIGTVAGLRGVKNLPRLVRAFAALPGHARLVIAGDGPERAQIEDEARRLGVGGRVHMPGFLPQPRRFVGWFDIFALSSDSEQFPISLVEAMAAGLPAVSTDVGDVRSIVAAENQPFIVPAGDEAGFAAALARLAGDEGLRLSIGEANRQKAQREYGEAAMIADYARLYGVAEK